MRKDSKQGQSSLGVSFLFVSFFFGQAKKNEILPKVKNKRADRTFQHTKKQEIIDSRLRGNDETGGNEGLSGNEGKVRGYPVKLGMTR